MAAPTGKPKFTVRKGAVTKKVTQTPPGFHTVSKGGKAGGGKGTGASGKGGAAKGRSGK